jgi:hypothetical protein
MNLHSIDERPALPVKKRVGIRQRINDSLSHAKRKMRAANPIAANQADLVNWPLYDRITASAGATTSASLTFFQVPIGTSGKTKSDTNLEQVSRLPDPQFYNATQIGFAFAPTMILPDIIAFLNAYYFEFWVGEKRYMEGPLQLAPSGTGVQGTSNITAAITQQTWTNGYPMGQSVMFDLRLPMGFSLGSYQADGQTGITILQGQTFTVRLFAGSGTGITLTASGATGGTGLNLQCFLLGILSRGVQ